jgi:hypothetical protein
MFCLWLCSVSGFLLALFWLWFCVLALSIAAVLVVVFVIVSNMCLLSNLVGVVMAFVFLYSRLTNISLDVEPLQHYPLGDQGQNAGDREDPVRVC